MGSIYHLILDLVHVEIMNAPFLRMSIMGCLEDMMMWRCTICGYIYDEAKEGEKFEDLPDDWLCPVCNAPKDAFVEM